MTNKLLRLKPNTTSNEKVKVTLKPSRNALQVIEKNLKNVIDKKQTSLQDIY